MPIPIGEITQAVTGTEVLSTSYSACDGLVATEGVPFRKLPKDTYALESHTHSKIENTPGTTYVDVAKGGGLDTIDVRANGNIRLYAIGYVLRVNLSGYMNVSADVRLVPAASGYEVYADDFILWSGLEHKTDVQDIKDSISKIRALKARQYTFAGKPRFGLVAEENPAVSRETVDETTGNPEKGVSQGDVVGLLLDAFQKLESRVQVLEGKGAGG